MNFKSSRVRNGRQPWILKTLTVTPLVISPQQRICLAELTPSGRRASILWWEYRSTLRHKGICAQADNSVVETAASMLLCLPSWTIRNRKRPRNFGVSTKPPEQGGQPDGATASGEKWNCCFPAEQPDHRPTRRADATTLYYRDAFLCRI